jgi:hypothetical protein
MAQLMNCNIPGLSGKCIVAWVYLQSLPALEQGK